MKSLSFYTGVILVLISISFVGCKKNTTENYSNDAIITGFDMRTTSCAGSYFLKFQIGPNSYSTITTDVSGISPLLKPSTFPIHLTNINWHYGGCGPQMIVITSYQQQ